MSFLFRERWRSLVAALVCLAFIQLLTLWHYRGPAPKSSDVADTEFSAERAVSVHEELFPAKPHPAGTVENLIVRDRLVDLLRNLGWTVEEQMAVVESDAKVVLYNVLARMPGLELRNDQRPLVLATHYDSCRTGPGAADAGGCVAALIEASRALAAGVDSLDAPNLVRPVYLLFTDGEELGLLGASQFVKRHPLSAKKPIVLNFDARGTSGPVVMYETHAGNRAAIEAWGNELARPRITGSLFTAVYRTLPNGSDFTVFQQDGWQGFNFAIIDGAHRYHQPDDTLANLDRRSLQHFGEHALKLARRIATTETELAESRDDAAFFDVLGLFVVSYPLWWCLPLSIAAFIVITLTNWRRACVPAGLQTFLRLGLCGLIVGFSSAFVGWFLSRLLRETGALPRSFVWYGSFLMIGLWIVSAAMSLGVAHWLLRHRSAEQTWSSVWLWWSFAGISMATIAPEFSHLLLAPTLLAAGLSLSHWSVTTRTLLVTFSSAILLVPVEHLLSIALGPTNGILLNPVFALLLVPTYPLVAYPPTDSLPAGPLNISVARRSASRT